MPNCPILGLRIWGQGLGSRDEGYKDTKESCLNLHLESDENTV